MNNFVNLFGRLRSAVIGMIHLPALPGAPRSRKTMLEILEVARKEASIYQKAGVDGIMVENMHDVPWCLPHQLGPETTAAMAVIAAEIRRECPKTPLGVQVMSVGNKQALAIAKAAGLDFMRCEGFVFSHVADEGLVHSCAAELIRYRKHIGAEHVQIFTDVKKKHCSHALTSDISIADMSQAAELFLSDGIIVTGIATGEPADPQQITEVQRAVDLPVLVGSGVSEDNLLQYMRSNAMIIGSHVKMHGLWYNGLDPTRVDHFMSKVKQLRDQLGLDDEPEDEHLASFSHILDDGA